MAAKILGWKYVGIEVDPKFVKTARNRVESACGQKVAKDLDPSAVAPLLRVFFERMDNATGADEDASRHYKAALQTTNDRSSRIARGEIIRKLLDGSVAPGSGFGAENP